MAAIAEDEPASVEELTHYAVDGRGWVAVADDEVIGYVIVDVVDGNAHVEQVSVDPAHQGFGVGRRLLDEVTAWARTRDMAALTLTTFTNVPWNRPLYEHVGFVVIPDAEIGPALRALVADEAAHGLDPAQRVCMRRPV